MSKPYRSLWENTMKSTTMASQIDTLLSTVFHPNVSSENAVECVDRLLSAFKQVGHATHHAHTFGGLTAGEDWLEN